MFQSHVRNFWESAEEVDKMTALSLYSTAPATSCPKTEPVWMKRNTGVDHFPFGTLVILFQCKTRQQFGLVPWFGLS